MSKAVPSKPPRRPFRPSYAVTTTTRVPGRPNPLTRPLDGEGLDHGSAPGPGPAAGSSPDLLG
jgi:hypothetical protein